MAEPIMVSAEELKEKWFGNRSTGMTHDHQSQKVIVHMEDGESYACTFDEKAALDG